MTKIRKEIQRLPLKIIYVHIHLTQRKRYTHIYIHAHTQRICTITHIFIQTYTHIPEFLSVLYSIGSVF